MLDVASGYAVITGTISNSGLINKDKFALHNAVKNWNELRKMIKDTLNIKVLLKSEQKIDK